MCSSDLVTVNGATVPLYFVSPNQINFQIPYTGLVTGRSYSVVVNQGGQLSPAGTIVVNTVSPGLFALNQRGSGQGAIRIANSATIAAPTGSLPDARPVKPGEAIEIYCTGLGAVSPVGLTGNITTRLQSTVLAPTVTVGGLEARVLFSGLNPSAAGLYQVNVVIPDTLSPNPAVPIELTINGVKSNVVTVAVGAKE